VEAVKASARAALKQDHSFIQGPVNLAFILEDETVWIA
jgi:hypothetical protein